MFTMNQITIIVSTGKDAQAHFTQNGTLVVTISVATKESWKDADRNGQSRTDWHRIVSFGTQAEFTRTLTEGLNVMLKESCACANMNAAARSTACSESALKRSASSVARNAALKLEVRSFGGRTRSSPSWDSALVVKRVPPPKLVSTSLFLILPALGLAKLLILWSGRRDSNPRMGYGAHCRWATDGDEKESISRYCGAPQTTKVDDVWQY